MARKKMTPKERVLLAEQMDRDLEEFIRQKVEANKDKPKEPFNLEQMEKVLHK